MANYAMFTPRNIPTATTTVVASGRGVLHSIVVNKSVASGVITIYDNTAASGTLIATITLSTGGVADQTPLFAIYDAAFATGLTVVTSAATDITVLWAPA